MDLGTRTFLSRISEIWTSLGDISVVAIYSLSLYFCSICIAFSRLKNLSCYNTCVPSQGDRVWSGFRLRSLRTIHNCMYLPSVPRPVDFNVLDSSLKHCKDGQHEAGDHLPRPVPLSAHTVTPTLMASISGKAVRPPSYFMDESQLKQHEMHWVQ